MEVAKKRRGEGKYIPRPTWSSSSTVLQGQERPSNRATNQRTSQPTNQPTKQQTNRQRVPRARAVAASALSFPNATDATPLLERGEGTFQGERTIRSYELTTATAAATKPTGKEEAGRKRFWGGDAIHSCVGGMKFDHPHPPSLPPLFDHFPIFGECQRWTRDNEEEGGRNET